MKYVMMLWPHANVRYQTESARLALGELRVTLNALLPEARLSPCEALPAPAIEIETDADLEGDVLDALRVQSMMYALFEARVDGSLMPVAGRAPAYVGADLPGVLKYKGKTNEMFLALLMDLALYSGGFAHRAGEVLEVLDPMCGRGTSLFVAANRGWNASGIDMDRKDLAEAERFLKHYFEFHRMKYALAHESRTLRGGSAPLSRFSFSDTPERFRSGDIRTLRLARADAGQARELFGREKFHMVVCDLPYGVQHDALGGQIEQLLRRALSAWREALKKGGTVAVSFNAQTLEREKVLSQMEAAGLSALCGGAYEGFAHWVEQAVTRDIVVARRTN